MTIKSHKGFDIKWNVERSSYADKQKALVNQRAGSMVWSPDGVWLTYSATGAVSRYTASTPWDVSTLGTYEIGTGSTMAGLFVSVDGLQGFTINNTDTFALVEEFVFSIPHDVTSNTYVGAHDLSSITVLDKVHSISFSPDGLQYFMSGTRKGGSIGTIESFTLSSPYDLSTAVADNKTFAYAGDTFFTASAMYIRFNGTKMYVGGDDVNGGVVDQYEFGTAWDVETLTFISSYKFTELTDDTTDIQAITFNPIGTVMYVFANSFTTEATRQYDIS